MRLLLPCPPSIRSNAMLLILLLFFPCCCYSSTRCRRYIFFVYVPNQLSESVFYSCWLLESICDIGKHAIFHWTLCTIDIFDLKFSGNLGHQSFAFRLASIISHSFASALSLSLYLSSFHSPLVLCVPFPLQELSLFLFLVLHLSESILRSCRSK